MILSIYICIFISYFLHHPHIQFSWSDFIRLKIFNGKFSALQIILDKTMTPNKNKNKAIINENKKKKNIYTFSIESLLSFDCARIFLKTIHALVYFVLLLLLQSLSFDIIFCLFIYLLGCLIVCLFSIYQFHKRKRHRESENLNWQLIRFILTATESIKRIDSIEI